jgi:hypothetical protein
MTNSGDRLKSQIEDILKGAALTTTSQTPSNQANSGVHAPYEWGGMYFRSKVEIKIAEELEKRGVTFFAKPGVVIPSKVPRYLPNTSMVGSRLISLSSIRGSASFSKLMAPNITAIGQETMLAIGSC